MANVFNITISATDRATESVKRINASIARITRPLTDVGRSAANLGRELGFDKVGKSLVRVGKSAEAVAGSVAKIVAPFAAVIGVGSLAGVAALATEWGRVGSEVARTSANLGVATSDLQSLRGAAQLAGVSSESLTGGLMALGDTINDAKWGRNQGALALMRRLGIGIHMTADGSVDAVRGLKDMAAAIGNIKSVQTQHMVARQFGVEALLPLLRKGTRAIEDYQKKIDQLGGVQTPQQIAAAANFGLQLNYLDAAANGLKNTIGAALVPVLTPLIESLTAWTLKNKDLIASGVAKFVEGFAKWVKEIDFGKVLDDVTKLVKNVDGVVESFGGWKNVIIGVGGVMTLSLLAPVLSLGLALTSLTVTTIPAAIKALAALGGASATGGVAGAAGGALPSVIRSGSAGLYAAGGAAPAISAGSGALAAAGLLGQAGYVGAAAAGGYLVGSLLNWGINKAVESMTGEEGQTLGSKVYDWLHPDQPNLNVTPMPKRATPAGRGDKYNDPALDQYANSVERQFGLPRNILNGIKNFGERSNSNDVSPAGARGVMQFMPATWKQYGKGDPSDSHASIDAAGGYMRDLLKRYGGNADAAIAEYNGGTRQAQLVAAGNQPSKPETRNYLSRFRSGMDEMNGTSADAAPAQQHNLTLTIAGLPSGVSARAEKSTGEVVPVRVAMAMPTLVSP
ncbi:phage tail tape measure protein [Janthinobacterium sp.]|uniref:phage tail tape measure protein n=1 Tax=Janthinobacterium sp. TaxID=1871054 RepID=UPI00293D3E0E|nr:phage tail tape measure protein [Janthinobacterium sp.]